MYSSHKRERQFTEAPIAAQTPAVKARYFPGLQPIVVRGVSLVVTTQMTVTPSVWALKRRPTPGSASGEVTIATITIPIASVIGTAVYKRGLDTKVNPGEELTLELTSAATAGAAVGTVEFDPAPELPANNSLMLLSA